ncbi:MAG: DPP IV N-terminal domain-containing protein [Deltaproteobacteria bacterium]|nr:DPP IV N-terminal domain-containing protein [Deltaproteobacteria bacterium]
MITIALVVAAASAALGGAWVPLPLERLQQEPPLEGRRPTQAAISPGGKWVTFLKPSATDSEVLDLWARPLPAGDARLLVSTSALLGGKDQKLSEQERMALERKRISKRGITSYQWCGDDDTTLLFPLSGDLYAAKLGEKGPETRRLTNDDDVPEQNPACTKDGAVVAYVKKGAVVTHDLKSNKTKVVTKGSSDTVSWGLPEFIAEEELGRHEGLWWSNDGKRLLILKVDERMVGVKVRAQIFADKTEMVSQRYPAAGEKNAVVSAFVVDTATGKSTPIPLPKDTEYIARGGFFADGNPYLQVLTRDQTKLTLLDVDAKTGKPRVVVEEKDAAWVEVHDDLDEGKLGLLWSSEASGRKQLERLERATGKRTPLTTQPEPVASLVCASETRVVFAGAVTRGRAQHLFVVDDKGATKALTSGDNWNDATANKACTTLLVTSSSWGVPSSTTLLDIASGKTIGTVDGDAPDPLLSSASRAEPVFLDVKAADGATILNGLYLPPATARAPVDDKDRENAVRALEKLGLKTAPADKSASFGPGTPVITFAYGGPTGQVVAHRWARNFPLFVHWQQRGFGVFLIDTRGMASRDRAFTRAHKNAFGKVEVDDVFAAARQLPRLVPGVDATRIGIFGWSYGGTLAARAMLDDNSPFAAGAAVAPVTDWTLYDTAYTERYLGLPTLEGNPAPTYASSSLLPRAKLLKKPLLIAHGTADDNVLFEHTLRLVQALQDEGALFKLSLYPGKAHGIAGKKSQLHLHKTLTEFFVDELRPSAATPGTYEGGLTRDQIQQSITPVMGKIKACYVVELKKAPTLEGKVILQWVIAAAGDVKGARASTNTFPAGAARPIEQCVVKVIEQVKFTTPKGGGDVNVTYPFVFAPG